MIAALKKNSKLINIQGFFKTQIDKSDIPTFPAPEFYSSAARTAQEVDDLEENLKNYESRIAQLNSSYETLLQQFLQLTELRHVLKESSIFFEQVNLSNYTKNKPYS